MLQNSKSLNQQVHIKKCAYKKGGCLQGISGYKSMNFLSQMHNILKTKNSGEITHHNSLMLLPEKGKLQQENLQIPAQ